MNMRPLQKGNNIFISMLNLLKIRHTIGFSRTLFETNPRKKSFQGMSDLFKKYGIKTSCYQFSNTLIEELPVPFVAVLAGDFFIIESVKGDSVKVSHNGKNDEIQRRTFYKGWNGQALIIEDIQKAQEPDYKKHVIDNALTECLVVLSIFSVMFLFVRQLSLNFRVKTLMYSFTYICGLYFSFLSLDAVKNSAKNKLCSIFTKSDCEKVHNSRAAYIFGKYSLGEIGVSYFASNIFILLFLPDCFYILNIINVIALIFSIWSIIYQRLIVKAWCSVCLMVQFAVIIQAVFLLAFHDVNVGNLHLETILMTLAVYILLFYVVVSVYRIYLTSLNNEDLIYSVASVKGNVEIFYSLLKQGEYFNTDNSSEIMFGNRDSKDELTVVLNPFCGPCKLFHEKLNALLTTGFLSHCKLRIVLTAFTPEKYKVVTALIAYYLHNTEENSLMLINNWYKSLDDGYGSEYSDTINRIYSLNCKEEGVVKELDMQNKWLEKNMITATPTVLFNGFIFPDLYEITDLKYLFDL